MQKIGFDRDKYIALQSEHIEARRKTFGGKLYLEFGGKLGDCVQRHISYLPPYPYSSPCVNQCSRAFMIKALASSAV